MKSTDIRDIRQQFREEKAPEHRKHARAKPAHLVVNSAEDPTTMFNTAGMQQFVPYLMGKKHSLGERVYNIQGCVRTNDIEEVGDVSHLTFFEMMGNWSLGDYFKAEAIARSREFLTSKEYLHLDPKNLAVSVFVGDADAPRDEESAALWKGVGVERSRIAYLGKKDNRWGPAGKTGPCGPDTEIFYRIGPGEAPSVFDPEKDDEHWLEIWNNVFMAYYKDDAGNFSELDQKNVDTGMGFERICMVVQGQAMKQAGEISKLSDLSVYDVDIFRDIIVVVQSYMEYPYPTSISNDIEATLAKSYRVIADHLRTGFFLVDEGLTPSNEGRGYVLRRILRRAYYHLMKIHPEGQNWIENGILKDLLATVFSRLEVHYTQLSGQKVATLQALFAEMEQFQSTLDKGVKKFEDMLTEQKDGLFSGQDAFVLYDTYGVPVELTQELVAQHGMHVAMDAFHQAMQKAQDISRAGGKQMFAKDIDWASYIEGLPPTVFVGYDRLEEEGVTLLKEFDVQGQKIFVLDRTPFYAESGGQKGDTGTLVLDSGAVLQVVDVQKYGGVYLHFIA